MKTRLAIDQINSYFISKPIEGINVVILYLYTGTIDCANTLYHATGYYPYHKIFLTVESKTNYKLVLCFKCNLTLQYSFYNAINAGYEYTITYYYIQYGILSTEIHVIICYFNQFSI